MNRSTIRLAAMVSVLLAVQPFTASAQTAMTEHEKELYEAAKKEPGGITWYNSVLDQQVDETVADAFAAKYPGLKMTPIKTTAQIAFQRLLQDLKAGQSQADVLTSTDVSQLIYLKKKGELIKYVPEGETNLVEAIRNADPDGYFHVGWVGLIALLYNTDKIKPADLPKDWPDFVDSKWKSQGMVGSPTYSGMVGVWTVAMEARYGWNYFEKLNALNPQIGRSIDDAVTVLNSGERSIAVGNPAMASRSAEKGNPVATVYPESGTLMVLASSGIIKDTKHPNTAKLFLEFLDSQEYSKILVKNYEAPLRPDVKPTGDRKSLTDVKIFAPSGEVLAEKMPENKSKWRNTFGM
jgi:iron(III) transport system substrate-binding protein